MINTILSVLPIFTLILTGYFLKQKFMKNNSFWKDAEKLTYYVLFPILLILKLSKSDFNSMNINLPVGIIILATVIVASLTFLSKWLFKIESPIFTSIFQGSTRYNSYVFLGMSASLFGETGLALCGIFIAYMIIFTNILSVVVLNHYSPGEKKSLLSVLKKIVKNPLIIGSLAGVFLNFVNIEISGTIKDFMTILGGAASPLSLMAVGAGLTFSMNTERINAIAISSLLKLIALPVITIFLMRAFSMSGDATNIAVLYACLPCAGNSYILARQMGGDSKVMASIITFTTIGMGVTAPVILQFFL